MEQESIFLRYIRHTFKRWAGFQEAINEGMGGFDAKEKEMWMGTEVENYFKRYSNVTPDDIEDYLGTMIENEFDTYFEDGSLEEISKNFCTVYPLSLVDPNNEIFQEMQKKFEVISMKQNSSPVIQTITSQEKPEEIDCEQMEKLAVNDDTVENDGWTTVTKRKKETARKINET